MFSTICWYNNSLARSYASPIYRGLIYAQWSYSNDELGLWSNFGGFYLLLEPDLYKQCHRSHPLEC